MQDRNSKGSTSIRLTIRNVNSEENVLGYACMQSIRLTIRNVNQLKV